MNNTLPVSVGRLILILFSILLIGALVFFRQRMLFVDPCFITFEILNRKSFVISEYRYGSFITQMVPLLGSYFKIDLKAILMLYSASFYIFYTSVIFFLVYRFKQNGLALLMAFYFLLFVSDVFYWPNNEVHQGIAWMFLFFGIVFSKNVQTGNSFYILVAGIVAFLAIFSHLIVAVPLFFLWAYFFFSKSNFQINKKIFPVFTILLIILFGIRMWLSAQGWYDGEKLKATLDLTLPGLIDACSNGHLISLAYHSFTNYWIAILIFLTGLGTLLWQRDFKLTFLVLSFTFGFLALLSLTHPGEVKNNMLFYMESQWMALGIIIAASFVFHFLPLLRANQILLCLIIIFAVRLFYIGESATKFNDRLAALNTIVQTLRAHDIPKAYSTSDIRMQKQFIMTWGIPVETLMLSAILGGDHVTLKITDDSIPAFERNIFYSSFRKMNVDELNKDYFNIDTVQAYQPAPYLLY